MTWLRVAALGLLLLAGCDPRGTGQRAGAGSPAPDALAARIEAAHLHRHLTQVPRTLDPSLNEDVGGYAVADDLFEGLVRLDAAGRIVPGVAESWQGSADGLVWQFRLRSGARWSNGDPVTARDFLFAWRRVLDPQTASPAAQQLRPIAGVAAILAGTAGVEALAVQAPDAHTLQVRLAAPTPHFLYLLTNC